MNGDLIVAVGEMFQSLPHFPRRRWDPSIHLESLDKPWWVTYGNRVQPPVLITVDLEYRVSTVLATEQESHI